MTMTKTWGTLVAIVAAALVVAFSFGIAPASAGVGVGVAPSFPATVTVGNTNVAVSLSITNNSTEGNGDPLTLTSITMVPSCGVSAGSNCTTLDPGVFSVDASGTGANACAANTFTIAETDAPSGEVTFTPNAAIALTPGQTCVINFTVDVVGAPDEDSSGGAGIQTKQLAVVSGTDQLQEEGGGFGADTTTVISPLEIVKTADGTFDRDWDWTIEKTVDEDELLLAEGETYTVNYEVEVTPTSEDVNHRVEGTITITNPAGNPDATIDELADIVDELDSDAVMDVNCEAVGFPVTLQAGGSLHCTYGGDADGTEDENTVTVTTSGSVPGGSDTVSIDWDTEPTNVTDECVTVNDDNSTFPGPDVLICEDDSDKTIEYSLTFGPEGGEGVDIATACDDDFNHPNIADFVTSDQDQEEDDAGDDDATVHVVVDCVVGCTLTQGYWKTHNDSFKGGAPVDDNWENIGAAKELTGFFTTVNSYPVVGPNVPPFTWFGVFQTAPKGNVYYNLAHQYMAAVLNGLNGADVPSDVQDALDDAQNHFDSFGPAATAVKGKNANKALKAELTSLAGILGSYNEGSEGVPHCDEQNPV